MDEFQNQTDNGEQVKLTLQYLLQTSDEIGTVFMSLIDGVNDGEIDALELWLLANNIEKLWKGFKESIENEARDEVENQGQKKFKYKGFNVEIKSGSRNYDFSNIDEIISAEEKLKALKQKYKDLFVKNEKGQLSLAEKENLKLPILKFNKDPLSGSKIIS